MAVHAHTHVSLYLCKFPASKNRTCIGCCARHLWLPAHGKVLGILCLRAQKVVNNFMHGPLLDFAFIFSGLHQLKEIYVLRLYVGCGH